MPAIKDLYLLYRQTGTGAGMVIGNAQGERYSRGSGVNQKNNPWYFKFRADLRDTTSGGTATIQVQTSPDNSTWTTAMTFTMLIGTGAVLAGYAKLFKTPLVSGKYGSFARLNVSAISGGSAPTLDAYMTNDGYGT